MDLVLTEVEARVLGCLIEKENTTPEYYPLTLNALAAACRQKSNRDPVMELDEKDVVRALEEMRYTHHLVYQVAAAGSRVPKYRHDLPGHYKLTPGELAILCVLLLRGPQTAGELKTRTRRMCKFETPEDVETALGVLMSMEGTPLVAKLPPGPGRREPRFAHLLCGEVEDAQPAPPPRPESATVAVRAENERLAALEQSLADLREEMEALREQFASFRKEFE